MKFPVMLFKKLSIKYKLILITMAVTVTSLFVGFGVVVINDVSTFKSDMANSSLTTAKLVAEFCTAPLIFEDSKGAEEALEKISSIPYIVNIIIFDNSGKPFAAYQRSQEDDPPKELGPEYFEKKEYAPMFEGNYLHIVNPIIYHDEKYGTIYLRATTDTLYLKITAYILTMAVVILLLTGLSYLFALRLQRLISKPLLHLSYIMNKISENDDYSLRVKKLGTDEIGNLYDGFNKMLEQINIRKTEKNIAAEQLRQTRNYLKNVFNSLPSILITINNQGLVTEWNSVAEKETGISSTEAVSKSIWSVIPFLEKYKNEIQEVMVQNEPKALIRKKIEEGESFRYINIFINPIEYDVEKGLVIRIDDITSIEIKEEQLRQAQKMETVGNLAGGLAHDFNNVLSGITGTVSLMKYSLDINDIDPDDLLENIKVIEESANRAADMVNQLLALSRKHDLFLTHVDLIHSIQHVLKICRSTFDKSVEISTQFAIDKAMVMADPAQIEQVILNVCINAMHAMTFMRSENERQGGLLTIIIDSIISDEHFKATHPEANESNYWIVRIRDTGVGMEPKVLAKIFDPFFTTKKMNKGTGLGLAMTYNIVQEHKGFIDVYSEPGIGSTFNIFLPKLENVESVEERKIQRKHFSGTGLILVVDDEEVIRKTARKILEHCGYTVVDAAEGSVALKLYRERPHDFIGVLLDMAMPKMSGKEVFAELQQINPNVKAIIASGFMQDKRIEEALHLGVKGFLHKPYSMYDLSKKIKEVFG